MRFFGRFVQEPYDPQLEFISKRIINVVCQYIGVRQSCYLLKLINTHDNVLTDMISKYFRQRQYLFRRIFFRGDTQ